MPKKSRVQSNLQSKSTLQKLEPMKEKQTGKIRFSEHHQKCVKFWSDDISATMCPVFETIVKFSDLKKY